MKLHDKGHSRFYKRALSKTTPRRQDLARGSRFALALKFSALILSCTISFAQAQDFLMCSSKRFQVFALPNTASVDSLLLIDDCKDIGFKACKGLKAQNLQSGTVITEANSKGLKDTLPENSDAIEEWETLARAVYYDLVGDDPRAVLGAAPTIEVIASPAPHAVATRSNKIFLTTGLLSILKTRSELAFVIGHELGHFKQGISHGRKLSGEQDADQFAVNLVNKAGYNAQAAEVVLKRLSLISRIASTDNNTLATYLNARLMALNVN